MNRKTAKRDLKPEENARLIAFYTAARAEIIQRLSMREQAMLAYLATCGVIASIAYKGTALSPEALQIIPLISLPFALAFLRHEWVIANINIFIKDELGSYLDIWIDQFDDKRDWDRSGQYFSYRSIHLTADRVLFFLVLLGPAIAALLVGKAGCLASGHAALFASSSFVLALTLLVLIIEVVRLSFKKEPLTVNAQLPSKQS